MLTDLGKMLRNFCTNAELKQEQLASDLGCSPGALSNYMNGKTVPEMEILAKCAERFNLKGIDLKNLFAKAFFGAIQTQQKIVLDTRLLIASLIRWFRYLWSCYWYRIGRLIRIINCQSFRI
jgi:transcriptional regulator with XRE-family HTH domain